MTTSCGYPGGHWAMSWLRGAGACRVSGRLFRDAVRLNTSGVILVHNLPSGGPTPSPDDLHPDRRVPGRRAGSSTSRLLDHLVIGRDRYVSLRDRGVGYDRTSQSLPDGSA